MDRRVHHRHAMATRRKIYWLRPRSLYRLAIVPPEFVPHVNPACVEHDDGDTTSNIEQGATGATRAVGPRS
jgi:hypothetical protein